MDFLVGGIAACGAVICSNPLDVIKTRMMLQGELKARGEHTTHYKTPIHAAYIIVKTEGVMALQKGLGVVMVMHLVENGARLGMYQMLHNNGYLTDHQGKTTFLRSLIASTTCGGVAAIVGSPLVLVKTHLQSASKGEIAIGYQHGYHGTVDAFKNIFRKHRLWGLWRGVEGTVLKSSIGSAAQLTTYFLTKELLEDQRLLSHRPILVSFLASALGGLFLSFVVHPFDVISCRLYNQGVDSNGRGLNYTGIADCFVKTYKKERLFGFYKGFPVNYARVSFQTILTLTFWERLKYLQAIYLNKRKND